MKMQEFKIQEYEKWKQDIVQTIEFVSFLNTVLLPKLQILGRKLFHEKTLPFCLK